MGAAWAVSGHPVARVHGYLPRPRRHPDRARNARGAEGPEPPGHEPGAGQTEAWGLVERGPDCPAVRQAQPARRPTSSSRIAGAGSSASPSRPRKVREADPLLPANRDLSRLCRGGGPLVAGDIEVVQHNWLTDLLGFMKLFDRAVSLLARAESNEIARGFSVLARLSDDSLDRVLRLFGSLPTSPPRSTLFRGCRRARRARCSPRPSGWHGWPARPGRGRPAGLPSGRMADTHDTTQGRPRPAVTSSISSLHKVRIQFRPSRASPGPEP